MGSSFASPLVGCNIVYYTMVIKPGAEPTVVSQNTLTIEGRVYGVAPVDGAFLIRSGKKLICVGKP